MSESDEVSGKRRRGRVIAIILAIAVVGALVAAWSGYRLYHRLNAPPQQTDVSQIAGWMTVGYISREYRVPPDELSRALNLPGETARLRRLDEIAQASGRSTDEVVAIVRQTVADHQTRNPEPPPRWPGGQSPFRRDRPPPPPGGGR